MVEILSALYPILFPKAIFRILQEIQKVIRYVDFRLP